ncbi:hypothetical protein OIY81_2393, partial [Cryptosporidium canis]
SEGGNRGLGIKEGVAGVADCIEAIFMGLWVRCGHNGALGGNNKEQYQADFFQICAYTGQGRVGVSPNRAD